MDRHVSDDQLDRVLLGYFAERQDELLATAPTAHLVAARIAAARSPAAGGRLHWRFALLIALLVALLAAAVVLVGSQLLTPSPIPADRGVFTPTGKTATGHENHTATLLPDGRVLVIGG